MHQRSRRYALACAVATAVFFLATVILGLTNPQITLSWIPYEKALTLAKEQNKPVFIDVYADWCEPCKRMDRLVFSDDSVQLVLRERYVPTRVNIDDPAMGDSVAKLHNVRMLPTYTVIGPQGRLYKQRAGALPRKDFLEWLLSSEGVQIRFWPTLATRALEVSQSQQRRIMAVLVRSEEDLRAVNGYFEGEKTRKAIDSLFVPMLMIQNRESDKRALQRLGRDNVRIEKNKAIVVILEVASLNEIATVAVEPSILFDDSSLAKELLRHGKPPVFTPLYQ